MHHFSPGSASLSAVPPNWSQLREQRSLRGQVGEEPGEAHGEDGGGGREGGSGGWGGAGVH